MVSRADVFAAINGERHYQDNKWGTIHQHPHEVGGWLLIMEKLLDDARRGWCYYQGDAVALEEIRKIAAVAVACMEQHGAPPRRGKIGSTP